MLYRTNGIAHNLTACSKDLVPGTEPNLTLAHQQSATKRLINKLTMQANPIFERLVKSKK
jgi:hypothetical protein